MWQPHAGGGPKGEAAQPLRKPLAQAAAAGGGLQRGPRGGQRTVGDGRQPGPSAAGAGGGDRVRGGRLAAKSDRE
eukprot:1196296-Prorocentrum_minimum.AAC.1